MGHSLIHKICPIAEKKFGVMGVGVLGVGILCMTRGVFSDLDPVAKNQIGYLMVRSSVYLWLCLL